MSAATGPGSDATSDDQRARAIVEQLTERLAVLSPVRDETGAVVDFVFEYLNAAARSCPEAAGLAPGRRLLELLPQLQGTDLFRALVQSVEAGESAEWPTLPGPFSTGAGAPAGLYRVRIAPLGDEISLGWSEVTERVRVEEALRTSDERFRAAIETMPDSLAIFSSVRDSDGRIADFRCQYVNAAAEQWTGAERASLIGHRLLELLPSYHDNPLFAAYQRVVEEGQPLTRSGVDFEDQFIGGNYQRGAYDVWASKLGDGLVLAWREVTGRKRQAEAVRESEELFRGVFDRAAVGMALLDARGRCLRVNAALVRLLGVGPRELQGKAFERYVYPEDQAAFRAHCGAGAAAASPQIELRCRGGDGRPIWTLMSCAEASPERLRVLQLVDIGPRKEAEAELARSNADLEQFAYAASHDLQEPLRMVTGYLQLLARRHGRLLEGEAAEFLQFAVEGAGRMKELIQDLLAYSRAGTLRTALEPCDLEAVLDRVLDNLRAAISESQAVITRGPLPVVVGDPTQLAQLLQNLIGNAIKFGHPDRRVTVHVAARREGSQAVITITDNGIGIEPGYLAVIFQPFRRLHTRQEYPGSGMGLAIVDRIVQRHGGGITVESQPGRGSSFAVRLPIEIPQSPTIRAAG